MKWEYKFERIFTPKSDDTLALFNRLGGEGWELVAVVLDNQTLIAYFKRQLAGGRGK